MKKKLLLTLLFSFNLVFIFGQINVDTPNLSFETGALATGWKLYLGDYILNPVDSSYTYSWVLKNPAQALPRIMLIGNGPTVSDPVIACSNFYTNPKTLVARIGDPTKKERSGVLNTAAAEKLEYTFTVTPNTTLLSYKLAAVLKVPPGDTHGPLQLPAYNLNISITDPSGVTYILPCSSYNSKADSLNHSLTRNTVCNSSIGSPSTDYVYQKWISGNINLSNQIGKTVTITIFNHDCLVKSAGKISGGSHDAYGYFWAETKKIELNSFSCENSDATIIAPQGFTSYIWTRSDGKPITIPNPAQPWIASIEKSLNLDGVIYSCTMDDANSACGAITVSTSITPIKLHPDFTFVAVDAGTIQYTSTSTSQGDSITNYYWDFGDGSYSALQNPIHTYTDFIPFNVKLTVTSSKGCSNTISHNVLPTKELIASIFPPANLVYNGQTKDFTATTNIAGLQMNIDYYIHYTNRSGTPSYNSYSAPATVGDYTATFELSYLSLLKYYINSLPSIDFTISKAPLHVTANNVVKTYGDNITLIRDAFTQDMKPLYAGDKIYELDLNCTGLNDTASVGNYAINPINAIGLGVTNYDIYFNPGTLTVNPKQLNINSIDNVKTYGDQINSTGKEFYIVPGSLVSNDSVASLNLQSSGFDMQAIVGNYPIIPSGATGNRLSNYTINYKPAIMLVNKKKITVSAKQLSKIYGTTYSFSGKEFDTDLTQFVGNDSISQIQLISSATPQKASVGDYSLSVTGINGYRLDNYDIKLINNIFKVNPMTVTIIANNKDKQYGDLLTFSGSEFTTDKPLITGDTVTFVSLKSSGCIETAPIGKYDISAAMAYGAGTLNYDFNYNVGTLNVVKKKLIASILPPVYLGYNGKNKDFTANVNVSGLLQNADYFIRYTNKTGTPTYNSITAPISAGDYNATFELSNSSLFKYYMDSIPNQDFTIAKAHLTITSNDAIKTYGDNLNLPKDAFNTDIKPLFGNDKIYELELSCTGVIDTASVGTYSIIGTKAIGIGLENYDILFVAGKLTVYPKSLMIKAIDLTKTYGEVLSPNGKEFYVDSQYLIGNDSVFAINSQCNGYQSNATVGLYSVKVSNATGRRLENYQISYVSGNLQVIKKTITVVATTISKIYGTEYVFTGNEFSIDKTQFVGNDSINSVQLNSPGAIKQSQVGDYNILISGITGKGLDNYEIKQLNNILKVTPMPVTIIANNISKPYGELLTLTGNEFSTNKPLVNGDAISYVVLKSSGTSEAAPVGDYDIFTLQAYGVGIMNYDITYQVGKLTVIQKTLSAKIFPPAYLVYNAQNKEFTATVNIVGLVQNTDYYIRYINKSGTNFYNSFIAPATVGNFTATFELSSLSKLKYSMDTIPSLDFSITKAPLTITADNATKTYGEKLNLQNDAFKMDMKPLFGTDIIYEVSFDCKGIADTVSVQKYPITPMSVKGSGIENYDIHYIDGTLTVNPKQLNVKALDGAKIYGDLYFPNPKSFYVDPHELVSNDIVTSVTLSSDGYKISAVTGSYPIKATNAVGSQLKNYLISYADGNLQVLKKKINVSAKPIFKVYGSEYIFKGDEFESNANQFVGNDKITGIVLNSQGAKINASVGQYNLSVTDVTGNGIENYDITTQNGIMFVTPKPVVVIGKDIEKEYGDVFTFSGNEFTTDLPMLNNDTISFAFLKSDGALQSASIGLYNITASQASGAGSLNYSISYRPGKLKVVQKQLQVTAQNCVKEYGENDPEKKFSVVDKRGIYYQSTMFSGNITREPGEKVGEYTISKGTLSISQSYSYSFTEGKLTIKKALPSIEPFFTNNNGQFITADVLGSLNGDNPQGNLNIKISQANIDNTIVVNNGTGKCTVSGLPNQMVVAEFNYLGDDNYLPATKTMNIYAIIYHSNGGTLTAPITNFDGNESVKLDTPTQDNNSKFEGWYENADFSGIPIRRIPIGTYQDVNLYAKWTVTYDDLSIVELFNQILAVANPLNREFLYKSTYKWYKDGVLLPSSKQYCGFENYIPTGNYRVEIYYLSNAPIVLELSHSATIQKSKVFPNPLLKKSQLTLNSELAKEEDTSIEVYNQTGMRLKSIKVVKDKDNFLIDGFENAGVYIIRVLQNGDIKEIHKIIVNE